MSGNIREVKFRPDPANSGIVQMLEQWLERAKNGDVQALALVGVRTGSNVATEWKGAAGHYHELNSGAAILQRRLVNTED